MDAQVNYRGVYIFKVDATGTSSPGRLLKHTCLQPPD